MSFRVLRWREVRFPKGIPAVRVEPARDHGERRVGIALVRCVPHSTAGVGCARAACRSWPAARLLASGDTCSCARASQLHGDVRGQPGVYVARGHFSARRHALSMGGCWQLLPVFERRAAAGFECSGGNTLWRPPKAQNDSIPKRNFVGDRLLCVPGPSNRVL